jgi:hypothetical protein
MGWGVAADDAAAVQLDRAHHRGCTRTAKLGRPREPVAA